MTSSDETLHTMSKNVSLPRASHHSRSFGIIVLHTLDPGTRLGYSIDMQHNKGDQAMNAHTPRIGAIGIAPNAAQCSWCGNGITKGTKVVYEGRFIFHLDRCAP